ncbi:MAG: amino acid adenylation domain-containing protein [Butyrivibrio sp.]|nr:amino acid adenylation domain-containing protein [Butyrivibrio sp.]
MYYKSVLEVLEETAKKYPERPAFGDTNSDMTFSETVDKSKRAGSFLTDYVKKGDPVAFYMEKSCLGVCGMFGAVYAGGFYSFIDVRQPLVRALSVINVLNPAVIITDNTFCSKAEELETDIPVFNIEEILSDEAQNKVSTDEAALISVRQSARDIDPLYVNFTSGSTGTPKGVTVCHRSVIEFISYFTDIFGITNEDILGNQAPFDFDVSVKDIYSGIMTGAKVQIIPREYFSSPMNLMDYVADKKVTVLIWAVSAMCFVSIMNGLDYRTPDTIRLIMFSGEVMPVKQLKIWQKYLPKAVYVNLYGPTEITCNCTYHILDREYADDEVIPAGKPFPNEEVFLLDEEDKLIPAEEVGIVGEICVSGTSVVLGYYNDPSKTAAVFVQNPLHNKYIDIIYRTGDLGKYDNEGNLIYVSRKDFQIKHLGHRIELGEIETAAMAKDGVSRACCIYDFDKKRIIMFYTGDADKKLLLASLKEVLPPFMIPNVLKPIEDMPLNKNGKIDRKALEVIYRNK